MKNTLYIESVVGPVNFYYYESDQSCFQIENLNSKNTEQMLTELSLKSINPNQIVLNIGPGSFTAIRTTVAIAKALFFKTNKIIYSCQTFVFISYLLKLKQDSIIVIDGFQEEYLVSFGGLLFNEIHQVKIADFRNFILSRPNIMFYVFQNTKIQKHIDGLKLNLKGLAINQEVNSAKKLCDFFHEYQTLFKTFDWISISPLYFKKSAAEEKLK